MSVKYSFVIPVYNVESYLQQCLDSIKRQDGDFECIIVNDGSTDSSGEIAQLFCHRDLRFHYYEILNSGVSIARNYAINMAKGKYIICVDSDDIISPSFLKHIDRIIQHDVDMICFGYRKFYDGDILDWKDEDCDYKVSSPRKVAGYPNYPWSRVTRKSLYENNEFPENIIYEDSVTIPILISRSSKVINIKKPLYGYRVRKTSLTNSSVSAQFAMFDALSELKRRCVQLNIPKVYYDTVFTHLSRGALISLSRLESEQLINKKALVQSKFKELSFFRMIMSYACLKDKVLFTLIRAGDIGWWLFLKLLKKFKG